MRFIVFLFILLFQNLPAQAEDINTEISFFRDDSQIYCLLNVAFPPGYHAYSHNPGGEGMPTNFRFTLAGDSRIPVFYQEGISERDPLDPGKTISIYADSTQILAALPIDSENQPYTAKLSLLLCSNSRCVPIKKTFNGNLPDKIPHSLEASLDLEQFGIVLDGGRANSSLPSPATAAENGDSPGEKPAELSPADNYTSQPSGEEELDLAIAPVYFSREFEVFSLWQALLFGMTAGLLLNAMPCVLPVLGLKINALLGAGNRNDKKALAAFRSHNFWFILGVMTFFSTLALLLGAADLLWGQLFQSQTLVLLILMLVFLMGLSMFGIFTLPVLNLNLGAHAKSPALQAFCSGLLCTFLATPCSGPLLGGVLAWAFTQPLPCLLAVFWAVGLGMSLPYVAFCIWPQLGRILPRPGNWMHIFETILGFLLLGTSLYLLSILPQSKRMHILCALLGIAFCAWLLGKFCTLVAPVWRQVTGVFFAAGVIAFSVIWIMMPQAPALEWQNFSAAQFNQDYGKKNMLLEFTADWCPNCKYLEATVLTEDILGPLKKNHELDIIKVDITNSNPQAEKLLNMLGSKSIPVTALFPKGENFDQPLVLRDIYSREALEKAVKTIF